MRNSRSGQLNRGYRRGAALVLALVMVLVTGGWGGESFASSANAPVIKTVTYKGKGKVHVVFREKVRYKDTEVTVKDGNRKEYSVGDITKGADFMDFHVRKCKKDRTYVFTIQGIKVRGFKRFTSVTGKFRSGAPEKPRVTRVTYDPSTKQIRFQFRDNVEWGNTEVTITRKGKKYPVEILSKGKKSLEVKSRKLKKGRKYKYTIKGVRSAGAAEYCSVKGSFRAEKK